jgi:hypothetical protein
MPQLVPDTGPQHVIAASNFVYTVGSGLYLTAGEVFLSARGFRKVLTLTYARLPLSQTNLDDLREIVRSAHPGYRLVAWDGVVPDDLAETFAASRRAMDDMPMDDTDCGTVSWDVNRVRDAALAIENRGELLQTVAAISESDHSVAGFTELVVPGDGKGDAQHYGTGVLLNIADTACPLDESRGHPAGTRAPPRPRWPADRHRRQQPPHARSQ